MKKLLASLLVAGLVFTTPLTSLAADNTNLATTEKTITATFSSNARSQGWWRKSGNRYWFQFANGGYARNVIGTINGVTYAFDSAGWMATGWVRIDGYWYYCNSNGAMQFGWKEIGGSWYYFDPQDGYMYAGNVYSINGKGYCFNSNGTMYTGWYQASDGWYYFDNNGMVNG